MLSWIKGIILGFVMLLPGVSGGTAFVILGVYEDLVRDLAKLNLKPHLKLFGGIVIGLFLSGFLFSLFFENHRNEAAVFLLGSLIASVRFVIQTDYRVNRQLLGLFAIGFFVGFILGAEPIGVGGYVEDISLAYIFTGAALSSAAMVIPGLPGSSVLILMGLYDNVFYYLSDLKILQLLTFGAGSLLGMFLLVKLLARLYEKYKVPLSYIFAGLILGSARALIPTEISVWIVILFILGFSTVLLWGKKAL